MGFGGKETRKLNERQATSRSRIDRTKRLDGRDRQIYTGDQNTLDAAQTQTDTLATNVSNTFGTYTNQVLNVNNTGAVPVSGQRLQTIRYNTALTATRAVTVGSGSDGDKVRVVRGPSATGGFNINVVDVLGSTIYTLSAVNRFVEVEFSFGAGGWIVSAAGSIA